MTSIIILNLMLQQLVNTTIWK